MRRIYHCKFCTEKGKDCKSTCQNYSLKLNWNDEEIDCRDLRYKVIKK